jgi:hypothetical protein
VDATYRDDVPGAVVEVQNHAVFGDATITVTPAGALTLMAGSLHQGIESVTGTGTAGAASIHVEIVLTFQAGGTANETIDLTKEVAPTPSPAPTQGPAPTPAGPPTPTPEASPTPGGLLIQGDVNCSGEADAVDALQVLRHVALLSATPPPGCPEIGSGVASLWGDADCNDAVDAVDALQILRHVAQLQVTQPPGCPAIGSPL